MSTQRKGKKSPQKKSQSVLFRIVIVSVLMVLFGGVTFKISTMLLQPNVLGASSFLARGGDDIGGGGSGGEHGGLNSIESGSHNPPASNSDSHGSGSDSVRGNTQVSAENVGTHGRSVIGNLIKPTPVEHEVEVGNELENVDIATNGGSFDVHGKHLGAISHFPISIDPTTNALIITTPAGTKVVTILPDRAVENILTKGIISKIGGHIASSSAEESGGSSSGSGVLFTTSSSDGQSISSVTNDNIELTEENGAPVYKVKGSLDKKLFGFIPVSVGKTVTVSADTGDITGTSENIFNRFLDLISL